MAQEAAAEGLPPGNHLSPIAVERLEKLNINDDPQHYQVDPDVAENSAYVQRFAVQQYSNRTLGVLASFDPNVPYDTSGSGQPDKPQQEIVEKFVFPELHRVSSYLSGESKHDLLEIADHIKTGYQYIIATQGANTAVQAETSLAIAQKKGQVSIKQAKSVDDKILAAMLCVWASALQYRDNPLLQGNMAKYFLGLLVMQEPVKDAVKLIARRGSWKTALKHSVTTLRSPEQLRRVATGLYRLNQTVLDSRCLLFQHLPLFTFTNGSNVHPLQLGSYVGCWPTRQIKGSVEIQHICVVPGRGVLTVETVAKPEWPNSEDDWRCSLYRYDERIGQWIEDKTWYALLGLPHDYYVVEAVTVGENGRVFMLFRFVDLDECLLIYELDLETMRLQAKYTTNEVKENFIAGYRRELQYADNRVLYTGTITPQAMTQKLTIWDVETEKLLCQQDFKEWEGVTRLILSAQDNIIYALLVKNNVWQVVLWRMVKEPFKLDIESAFVLADITKAAMDAPPVSLPRSSKATYISGSKYEVNQYTITKGRQTSYVQPRLKAISPLSLQLLEDYVVVVVNGRAIWLGVFPDQPQVSVTQRDYPFPLHTGNLTAFEGSSIVGGWLDSGEVTVGELFPLDSQAAAVNKPISFARYVPGRDEDLMGERPDGGGLTMHGPVENWIDQFCVYEDWLFIVYHNNSLNVGYAPWIMSAAYGGFQEVL